MTEGHRYFLARLAQVSDDELSAPSALPGWTGRHILSHVGHNARAVGRLAHWAATGEPTPMYSGPDARAAEIALGARWDPARLRSFVVVEQDALAAAFEKLDVEHWATEVVTAQGRHVTAAALPWLRTREVWIHAADLHGAADFSDFPPPLLDELIADVLRWRRAVREEALQVRACPVDLGGCPRRSRRRSGKAEEESDTAVVSATTTMPASRPRRLGNPVGVWASWAPPKIHGTGPKPTDRDITPPSDVQAPPVWIEGRTADLARWLTGRGAANIQTSDQSALPTLGPWL